MLHVRKDRTQICYQRVLVCYFVSFFYLFYYWQINLLHLYLVIIPSIGAPVFISFCFSTRGLKVTNSKSKTYTLRFCFVASVKNLILIYELAEHAEQSDTKTSWCFIKRCYKWSKQKVYNKFNYMWRPCNTNSNLNQTL